jgi:hypothetical protein
MTEQGMRLHPIADGRWRACQERRAIEHNHPSLWKRLPADGLSELTSTCGRTNNVGASEQVVGGEQSVSISATKFGLHPEDGGRGRITFDSTDEFAQHAPEVRGEVGLVVERLRVSVFRSPLPSRDQPQVGSETGLVERPVGNISPWDSDLTPG